MSEEKNIGITIVDLFMKMLGDWLLFESTGFSTWSQTRKK